MSAYDARTRQSEERKNEKRNAIFNDAASLEGNPREGFAAETCRQFKRLISGSYVRCFDFDCSDARKMLVAAQEFCRTRAEETSRHWYLPASIRAWLPFAISIVGT